MGIVVKVDSIDVDSIVLEIDNSLISEFLITDGASGAREYLLRFLAEGCLNGRPEWDAARIKKDIHIAIPSLNLEYILQEQQEDETSELLQEIEEQVTQEHLRDTTLEHVTRGPLREIIPEQATREPLRKITLGQVNQVQPQGTIEEHQKNTTGLKRWTYRSTIKLIEFWNERKERFENNIEKNESIWEDLAAAMRRDDLNFTAAQCENKFKYLKRLYMETKDFNRKSTGQPEKTCPFYEELDAIFRKSPLVSPPSLISSRDGAPTPSSSGDLPETSSAQPPKKKTRLESSLSKWAENFQTQSTVREAARQKRHEDILQIQRETNELYKNLMLKLLEKL